MRIMLLPVAALALGAIGVSTPTEVASTTFTALSVRRLEHARTVAATTTTATTSTATTSTATTATATTATTTSTAKTSTAKSTSAAPAARTMGRVGGLVSASRTAGALGPRQVRARTAFLADAGSGERLWSRHAGARRQIGSITKVMTALIVLRAGHLDRKIRVKPAHVAFAAARNGSTARLRVGDRLTARELLYAMMLPSGCDAAAALADTYGRGQGRFVRKMNRTARRLGMSRTHYADMAGLSPAGFSTARDQTILGLYAMRDATFRQIVSRGRYVARGNRSHHRYVWRSTNELLGAYPGILGIKSGHTSAAGYSFLFAARRYGRTLVGTVLNSSQTRPGARFADAARVLNWGFR